MARTRRDRSEPLSNLSKKKISTVLTLVEENAPLIEYVIQTKIKSWYTLKSLLHDACVFSSLIINPSVINQEDFIKFESIIKEVPVWLNQNNLISNEDNKHKAFREMWKNYLKQKAELK